MKNINDIDMNYNYLINANFDVSKFNLKLLLYPVLNGIRILFISSIETYM